MLRKILFYILLLVFLIINIFLDINIQNYFTLLENCFGKNIELTSNLYVSICSIITLISVLIIIAILLVAKKQNNQNKGIKFKLDDGTYGTANWMQKNEIGDVLSFDKPGIILGKYENKVVKLPFDSNFNKNIAVFGSSGSMKTIGFLLTNLLELSKYKKSIVVTDPKSEIYRKTSSYFRNIGYTVKVFNLKDLQHSDRWNPLEENITENDVQTSSYVIISNTQKQGAYDFWPKAEENLLQAFEYYFLETVSSENTLANIYDYITSNDIKEIEDIFRKLPKESLARKSYFSFAKGNQTIESSVFTGLSTRLKIFQNKNLQKITAQTDIDLTLPGKQPCIYYVITSDVDSSFDVIASLFYTFLFQKLVEYADAQPDGRCKNDVFFYLDEFANLGQIPDFNKKISTVRSRGLNLIPILQNYPQLTARYPKGEADEIMGNCDTRLNLRYNGYTNCKLFLLSNSVYLQFKLNLLGNQIAWKVKLKNMGKKIYLQ